jgi:ubiquinone/menaquinone biosynthesis C-methylase UbiE
MNLVIDKDKNMWVGLARVIADFRALPFEDATFDKVVIDPSQEDLLLDSQIAKEFYRVSKR